MSRRTLLALAAWFAALAIALTWPAVLHMDGRVLGDPSADGMKHIWTLWWIRHAVLVDHAFPFHTDVIDFPAGIDLYPIEPLGGLVAILAAPVSIPVLANLLALSNLALTGFCAALLGRRLAGTAWGAFAAGTLLESSAFALFTVHVGVGELQHLWWLPLGALAWIEMREQLRWRDAARLGLVLAGAMLSCFYHGFFLAIGLCVLAAATAWAGRRTPRLLLGYALAAALALALVLPVARAFSSSYAAGEVPHVGLMTYVLQDGNGQPVTDPPSTRLDPAQLVLPASRERTTAGTQRRAYGGGRYLGLPLLVLALAGLVAAPRRALPWLLLALAGAVLATGSYLVWGGEDLATATAARLRMPFFYLNRALGYLAEPINFPVRFVTLTVTGLVAAAALAARLRPRGLPAGPAVAVLAILNAVDVQAHQLIPRPMPSIAMPHRPELEKLSAHHGALVDLAVAWRADRENRAASLAAQVLHGQHTQAVPIERIEYFAQEGQLFVQALPMLRRLEQTYVDRRAVRFTAEETRGDLALLRDAGFDRLLLLTRAGQPHTLTRDALLPVLGPPEVDTRGTLLFRLPGEVQATPQEIAEWKKMQAERIARIQASRTPLGPQLK